MSLFDNFKKILKINFFKYRPLKINKFEWEKQFEGQHWDYLNDIKQLSRYSVICGYFEHFSPKGGRVLDVGCGQGILYYKLKKINSFEYVGIDISETAIELAKSTSSGEAIFFCTDLTKFFTDLKFDFIVFNESLYYLNNPLIILNKYSDNLNYRGKIIVSMWDNKERNNKLWNLIEKNFNIIDSIYLKNLQNDFGWILKIFEKKIMTLFLFFTFFLF
jgi:2-polyprenyl-3-methyl-5-hydroxy-6-metoxy-1,4-benzoquinol methylase